MKELHYPDSTMTAINAIRDARDKAQAQVDEFNKQLHMFAQPKPGVINTTTSGFTVNSGVRLNGYLGLEIVAETLSVTGNRRAVSFGRSVAAWGLFCRLWAAKDSGMTRVEIQNALWPEASANRVDQEKAKANEILEPLKVLIESDGRGVFRLADY